MNVIEMQAKTKIDGCKKEVLQEVARRLAVVASKARSGRKLTARSAFFKWLVVSNAKIIPRVLQTILRNSRVTPSKALHALFSRPGERKLDFANDKVLKSQYTSFTLLCQLVKRVTYSNKQYFVSQVKLSLNKGPLLKLIATKLVLKSYYHTLRELERNSRERFQSKTFPMFERLHECLKSVSYQKTDARMHSFWAIKLEAVRNTNRKVRFADEKAE